MTGPDEPGKVVAEPHNLAPLRGICRNIALAAHQATGSRIENHDAAKLEIMVSEFLASPHKNARRGLAIDQLCPEILGNLAREDHTRRDRQVRGLRSREGAIPAQVIPGLRLRQAHFVRVRTEGVDGKVTSVSATGVNGASSHEKTDHAEKKAL